MVAICRQFTKGKCSYGAKCKYSHDIENHRHKNDGKICHHFVKTGSCKFGAKCEFIHPTSNVTKVKARSPDTDETYAEFLKRSLSSPSLSGKKSEEMIYKPLVSSNSFLPNTLASFLNQKIRPSNPVMRKKFISALLTDLTNDALIEKTMNLLVENITVFYKIVAIIIKNSKESQNEFVQVFCPLIIAMTNSQIISGPFIKQSNLLYGVIHDLFEQLIDVFSSQFPLVLDARSIKIPNINKEKSVSFEPLALSHYILPTLEIVIHIVKLFHAPKFTSYLEGFIKNMEKWILIWKNDYIHSVDIVFDEVSIGPIECFYNVTLAQRLLESLSRISNVALEQIKTNETIPLSRNKPMEWVYGTIHRPGNRHSNDHHSIQDISVEFVMDEILCTLQPPLPGNHQLTPEAHWLPYGPARLLDTHFRLFREDMMRSIRTGIQTLFSQWCKTNAHNSKPKKSFRFDHNLVVFINANIEECVFNDRVGVSFLISYTPAKSLRSDFGRGSLAAVVAPLSKEILFVKVLEKKGNRSTVEVIPIGSNGETELLKIMKSTKEKGELMIILMRNILYESTMPLLHALKSLDPNEIPFSQYLCPLQLPSGDMKIDPPTYTRPTNFRFNLSFLVDQNLILNVSDLDSRLECLEILQSKSSMDEGQCEAFVSALSCEYACVQGPPGTGKSYLGVKIIQTILQSVTDIGPIIIICHTNHALDQFLENLLDIQVDKIVRLGTRSSSDRIKKLLLNNSQLDNYDYRKTNYDLRQLKKTLSEKFKRDKSGLNQSMKGNSSWENVSRILNQFFPPEFTSSLEYYYMEQEEDGFAVDGEKGKQATNAWETWLFHSNPSVPKTDRELEDLFETEDPWILSKSEKEKIKYFVQDMLLDGASMGMSDFMTEFKSYKTSDAAVYTEMRYNYLKYQKIIGMTTTGAAMNQDLIKRLNPSVVLCEEAGEVLEAHTLAFLNPGLSHLIMIGDHLQLRPQISEYALSVESKMGKKYALDLSQFERMQLPEYRYPLVTLSTQRRMRPEISQLIRNTIYPALLDSPSVQAYPDVLGMRKNVFFMHHLNSENKSSDSAEGSHRNSWEATFCVLLAKYFLNQGYDPKHITILTPYLGQLLTIKESLAKIDLHVRIDEKDLNELRKTDLASDDVNEDGSEKEEALENIIIDGDQYTMKKHNLKECIRVSTVDNYQGEENRIIIASLVRNCGDQDVEKASIGFLATENRTNVLLSRAKEGLYLFGHIHLLMNKSTMWNNILNILDSDNCVGDALPLRCQLHPEYEQDVKDPNELGIYYPDGGCTRPCSVRLSCGHKCTRLCHSDDPNHIAVFCSNDCLRIRDTCGHACPKRCGDNCGSCKVVMENFVFPSCNHVFESPKCFQLPLLTNEEMKCCKNVVKEGPCGHKNEVMCHQDQFECQHKCQSLLECGHKCQNYCHFGSENHTFVCTIKCEKILYCGHYCHANCHSDACPPCSQKCEMMKCEHSFCDHLCSKNCKPCIEKCTWVCEHVDPCPLPCGAPCIRIPCDLRCKKNLECGHQCPSICGEPCPEKKYCKECTQDSRILEAVADLIMFTPYQEIDLDLDPIIVLDCGHFKTVETLDGILSIDKFYLKDEDGKWISNQFPAQETDLVSLPCCPDCRKPISSVRRYGRIIRSAQLDQSEKRYVVSIQRDISELSSLMVELQNTTISLKKAQRILKNLKGITKTPSQHLWVSCLVSLKKTPNYYELYSPFLNVPKPQNGVNAKSFLLISQCEGVLFEKQENKNFYSLKLKLSEISNMIQKGAEYAEKGHNEKLENEITLEGLKWDVRRLKLFAMPIYLENVSKALKTENVEEALKEMASVIILKLNELMNRSVLSFKGSPSYKTIDKLLKSLKNFVSNGYFESEIDLDEAFQVFKALMTTEGFRGSGHFYRCSNGHIYVIGECGMAMQASFCPECGEAVGGSNHVLNSTNSRATELEQVLFRMNISQE